MPSVPLVFHEFYDRNFVSGPLARPLIYAHSHYMSKRAVISPQHRKSRSTATKSARPAVSLKARGSALTGRGLVPEDPAEGAGQADGARDVGRHAEGGRAARQQRRLHTRVTSYIDYTSCRPF